MLYRYTRRYTAGASHISSANATSKWHVGMPLAAKAPCALEFRLLSHAIPLPCGEHRADALLCALAPYLRREVEAAHDAHNLLSLSDVVKNARRPGAEARRVRQHRAQRPERRQELAHVLLLRRRLGLVHQQHGRVEHEPVHLHDVLPVRSAEHHTAPLVEQLQRAQLLRQLQVACHRLGGLLLDARGTVARPSIELGHVLAQLVTRVVQEQVRATRLRLRLRLDRLCKRPYLPHALLLPLLCVHPQPRARGSDPLLERHLGRQLHR
mmetsp:Transcript_24757/g.80936  ORF Transcript_24757/g.80936 Transcript_24757/m.80936 type:complete len:267 (-) Transcript_24757:125-925(-)